MDAVVRRYKRWALHGCSSTRAPFQVPAQVDYYDDTSGEAHFGTYPVLPSQGDVHTPMLPRRWAQEFPYQHRAQQEPEQQQDAAAALHDALAFLEEEMPLQLFGGRRHDDADGDASFLPGLPGALFQHFGHWLGVADVWSRALDSDARAERAYGSDELDAAAPHHGMRAFAHSSSFSRRTDRDGNVVEERTVRHPDGHVESSRRVIDPSGAVLEDSAGGSGGGVMPDTAFPHGPSASFFDMFAAEAVPSLDVARNGRSDAVGELGYGPSSAVMRWTQRLRELFGGRASD
ncbi:hypothetical protein FVE85_0069 [Porphyridium purpureum]|uniref:Uncharacterized protein n=1 Tax=Porphyridium purpureum TaxID=35688 RepID=A0A5J4YZC3_PORPP|nr:hypothetical protein FVE85_0069 [Porphyridium purpureum]|eukprot:POR6980..scf208_2